VALLVDGVSKIDHLRFDSAAADCGCGRWFRYPQGRAPSRVSNRYANDEPSGDAARQIRGQC
jgi:hypothetical protein